MSDDEYAAWLDDAFFSWIYGSDPEDQAPSGGELSSGWELSEKVRQLMPSMDIVGECPYCAIRLTTWETLQHLNDIHQCTREEIADWIEASGNNPEFPTPDTIPKEPGEE